MVVSEAFTRQVPLSTYFDGIRGTLMDVPVFVFDSGVPGGSVLILGGAHAYEPASPMMAYVMMENIAVTQGKVFVIARANMSASTLGMLGNAYPPFFRVKTPWGETEVPHRRPGDEPARAVAGPVHVRALSVEAEPRVPGQPEPQPDVSRAAPTAT